MPASGGIQELRQKLHARMASLRRGNWGTYGEAGSRDELLEERRRQRAEMRERRRKETRGKIKREEEARGKKSKDKEQQRTKGPLTKVCRSYALLRSSSLTLLFRCRTSYLYQTSHLHRAPSSLHQVSRMLYTLCQVPTRRTTFI